mgnify:CR=1 FL=1
MIYLDYSATTPMSERAMKVYAKVSQQYFGNANSLHDHGTIASNIIEHARQIIAKHIHAEPRGLYFTSGGTESNQLAILSLANAYKKFGKHIITTPTEHPSVLNTCKLLEKHGFSVTYLPVNEYGEVQLDVLEKAIRPDTILVSIAHASSELGTVQNLAAIGKLLKEKGVIFHSDCVQTFGKIPIDVKELNIDSISISAHKIYGPKGIGACYINPKVSWSAVFPNGTHEKGFRSGTLNTPAIAAFAEAAEEIMESLPREKERLRQLQTYFLEKIDRDKIVLEGHPTNRLPHHLCLRIKGIEGQYVMLECNRYGIAISTGSACQIGHSGASMSMVAIGRSEREAHEMIRITFGKFTTKKDIDKTVQTLHRIIQKYYEQHK